MAKEQIIKLSEEDRELIKKLIKWIRFFPLMYLFLWILLCTTLFLLMWTFFGGR